MTKRNEQVYIRDIVDSIERIEDYTKGLSFEQFSHDQKTIDAVIRNFEIIGEATKNLSNEIKSSYQDIPWKEMAGMRDKMIHDYSGVDLDIIWKTIKERLLELKKSLEGITQ